MKITQGNKLLDQLYSHMDNRQYADADTAAKKLIDLAEKHGWDNLQGTAWEMRLAIAIETNCLDDAGMIAEKLAAFPATAYRLFLQARVLYQQGKNYDALEKCQAALKFAQANPHLTQQNILEKIYNLLAKQKLEYGFIDEAIGCYYKAMQAADVLPLKVLEYSNYLFSLHYRYNSSEDYYMAHTGFGELLADIPQYAHEKKYELESLIKKASGKIRIGYISPDFRNHVVLRFCWVMLTSYDKSRFEVYCYHNKPIEDSFSEKIKKSVDKWQSIYGLSHKAAAELIYNDRIDILVDLAGHTQGSALPVMAYKPAPVQMSGIGYFATTGLKTVDYFLSDRQLESEKQYFTEELIELEHSHFCYAPLHNVPASSEAPCMNKGYVTFGSFNNIRKINDEVLELWADILKSVPNSHLLLKAKQFDDEYGLRLFKDRLAKLGIDTELPEWKNRVELRGFSHDYLKEYLEMDIALDTFPYPGGGTTCDALYMGVPVITVRGSNHGERFGVSLLTNIGLPEFVVESKQAYFNLAVALAASKEIINNLHIGLRHMMENSPLMDKNLYMSALEAAYSRMWERYVEQLPEVVCPRADILLTNSFECYKNKDYDRAKAWCRLAIDASDNDKLSETHSLAGDILQAKLDYVEALKESRLALEILSAEANKGTAEYQQRLWLNYAARCYKLGFIVEAVKGYQKASEFATDIYNIFGLRGSALMVSLCQETRPAGVRRSLAEINALIPYKDNRRTGKTKTGKKIHIGYISPDFRQHVMFSFYYTMLHGYDREKFHVTCISLSDQEDGYTEHLKGLVDVWVDVSDVKMSILGDELRRMDFDILVDLAGHSSGSGLSLFNNRMARVQISGLGWMESTGMTGIDYLLTDRYITQDDAEITEKPLYLASQFCYTGRNDVPVPQGAPCNKNGYVVFGVFNHYYKITDDMLIAWKKIMDRVPESRILFKSQVLVSDSAKQMVKERLTAFGFDMGRILLEPATNTYMSRYLDVDIALDTYPYPGGGTTCDALYMGVPVVSMYGQRCGSRFGLSILSNAGVGELAVDNIDAYVERAVGMAQDRELLDMLHKNLRGMLQKAPIMDSKGYIAQLESAYERILAGK